MRVQRPTVKNGALLLTRGRGHFLRRPDKIPKSPRSGVQMLAQYLVGEEGEEKQGRASREVGSCISQTSLDAYCVVVSGGKELRFKVGLEIRGSDNLF